MQKNNIKEFNTAFKELVVRIYTRDGGKLLFGRGIDPKTREPHSGCTAKLRLPSPLNTNQLPDFERMLLKKIELKFEKKHVRKHEMPVDAEKGIYTAAFELIEDKNIFHRGTWNDQTFDDTLKYFIKKILPILDKLGLDICSEDILKLQDDLILKTSAHKRSNANKNDAASTVSANMFRADCIYQVLRDNCPTFNLPDINLSMNNRRKKVQKEQPKALPDYMRIMLARLFFRLVSTPFGGLALAAAMMFFTNLRTAESAAVCFGKIIKKDKYATYFVQFQEKDRKMTNLLKTGNAYRWIILPKIMLNLIIEREEYLIGLGHTPDIIKTLPITYESGDPEVLTSSSDISAFVRKLLHLIGCTDEYFVSNYKLMHEDPDIVDGEKVCDVSAYILRRDWATRASNICGLQPNETDYLIGHAIKKELKKNFQDSEVQAAIAYALERYVFDPNHSCNPAYEPIVLSPGEKLNRDGNQAFVFETGDKEITLELTVSCLEAGNTPSLIVSSDCTDNITRFGIFDKPELRKTRPIIGNLIKAETYSFWINNANNINLKKLEEK